MAIQQVIVRDPAELRRWERAWWELLRRSDDDEPVLSPFWARAWWRVFGGADGRKLCVWFLFDGDRLIGLAPLLSRRYWYRPGVPFRRLELVGSGEAEADEICSEYLGVVAERGYEERVVSELAVALVNGRLGEWDELVLSALRGESPTTARLAAALERAGLAASTSVSAECPYVALPKSWDDYVSALSSSSRRFVKQTLAAFDAWAGGDATLHEVRTAEELERGVAVLQRLHGERWSEKGRSGVFASPKFAAFHGELMPELLREGALELLWLEVRGAPVAVLYNFVWNGKVHFYQSGRSLDVPETVRPGIALHLRAIRRAIEAGRREYDFLGGASQYKKKLATASRKLVSVRAVRSPVLELARSTLDRGIDALRGLLPTTTATNPRSPREARR